MVTGLLLAPLSPEQGALLQTMYKPFHLLREWPVWQYTDLTLDAAGIDAEAVLASLPAVGTQGGSSLHYGLTWRTDMHLSPRPEARITLTIAGLRHLEEAGPLCGAFLTTIRYLVEQQRMLVPSPSRVVEATVKSPAIRDEILSASITGRSGPPVDALMGKLGDVLAKEPFLYNALNRPNSVDWEVRVPAVLRQYRDVATIEEYVDRVTELVTPTEPSSGTVSLPDIPNAVGYLDAVWKSRTGSHLFVNLDPASIARLTQACLTEEDFNSLMSALADVLAQVVAPGSVTPPQRRALEAVRDYLASDMDPDVVGRVTEAVDTLILLRHIRVSTQHRDARHRAVNAFQKIGLPFPPPSWEFAWAHIATQASGALDAVREEVRASLHRS